MVDIYDFEVSVVKPVNDWKKSSQMFSKNGFIFTQSTDDALQFTPDL